MSQGHEQKCSVNISTDFPQKIQITISGRLDTNTAGKAWEQLLTSIATATPDKLSIDASGISYCDMSGIGLFLELKRIQESDNKVFELKGLKQEYTHLFGLFDSNDLFSDECICHHQTLRE